MLEAARDLFEAAPKVATVLEEAATNIEAEKKKEADVAPEEKVKVVPKVLAGVSMSLIEKIRAKEREKKVLHETNTFICVYMYCSSQGLTQSDQQIKVS